MAEAIDFERAFPRRRVVSRALRSRARERDRSREQRWKTEMIAAQRGDTDAYHELLHDVMPEITRLVHRRVFDPAAAEDVIQNCLVAIHRGRHSYRPDRPFLAWLRAIVRNTTFDHLRQVRRRREVERGLDHTSTPEIGVTEDHSARLEASNLLDRMLDALPRDQREAIELVKIQGLSGDEAARRVGISAGALRLRVHRGCRTLREQFGECWHRAC